MYKILLCLRYLRRVISRWRSIISVMRGRDDDRREQRDVGLFDSDAGPDS